MRRSATIPPSLARNAPVLLLGLAAISSAILLLALQSGMTFFQDEWHFVIHRRGFNADAFFLPNDVHPVPLPAAVYKLSLALFGMTSVAPDRVIAVLVYTVTAILLFAYVRRRLGDWLALFPAVILLFLGPAWNVLLWPFEMTLAGSVAAGLAMLLALDRNDRAGDVAACALAVVSMACSSLGISFAIAAGVDILLRWRERGLLARLYVPALPLALYSLWYLTYGHKVPSALSFFNVARTPLYVADAIASSIGALVGLSTFAVGMEGAGEPEWGRPILVAIVALTAIWLYRKGRVSPQIWVVVAAAAAFWVLGGFNFIPGREPTASRYQYIGAVFVVLIVAEIFKGVRLGNRAILALLGLTGVVVLSNLAPLRDGRTFVKQQSDLARAELAAIEIARDTVRPDFVLTPEIAGTATLIPIDAGSYLSAVDTDGSPAADKAELPRASEAVRQQVDVVLAHALPVTVSPLRGKPRPIAGAHPPTAEEVKGVTTRGSCVMIASGAAREGIPLVLAGSTTIEVAAGKPVNLALRRYAGEFALPGGILSGGSTSLLSVPPDRSSLAWQITLTGAQAVAACTNPKVR